MIQPFMKPNWSNWTSDNIEASKLIGYQRFWKHWTFNAFYQISIKKNSKAKLCSLNDKGWIFRTLCVYFWWFFLRETNARLRGWQRINTKLKYNNRNHFGSLRLETPRVDSPSWGVCYAVGCPKCCYFTVKLNYRLVATVFVETILTVISTSTDNYETLSSQPCSYHNWARHS